jgi:hypothetical protein
MGLFLCYFIKMTVNYADRIILEYVRRYTVYKFLIICQKWWYLGPKLNKILGQYKLPNIFNGIRIKPNKIMAINSTPPIITPTH